MHTEARGRPYRVVQELAQRAWDTRVPLRQLIEERSELGVDVDVDLDHYARYAEEIVGRLDGS